MPKAQLVKRGTFKIGDRVELTQEGVQQLVGVAFRTGTVVGFSHNFTLRILLDGYRSEIKFPASLWRIIETNNE